MNKLYSVGGWYIVEKQGSRRVHTIPFWYNFRGRCFRDPGCGDANSPICPFVQKIWDFQKFEHVRKNQSIITIGMNNIDQFCIEHVKPSPPRDNSIRYRGTVNH